MIDDPSSRTNYPPSRPALASLTVRDMNRARVDELLSGGLPRRPQAEGTAPVSEESAQPVPPPKAPQRRSRPVAKPEKQGGFSALHWFFQLFLLLFVLVWVFLLGIFIGRGYLMDSPHGRSFIAWVETFADPKTTAAPIGPQEIPAEVKLEVKLPEAALALALNAISTPGQPEDNFLTSETLALETPAPQTPPSPSLAAEDGGGYAVQTTYALNERAARALIERLKRQGFPAYFYKNSRDQYLVRVGRFKTVDEARAARDSLARIGYKEPYISRLEPGEK